MTRFLNQLHRILTSFRPNQNDWVEYDEYWDDYCACCDPGHPDPEDEDQYLIHEEDHITDLI